MLTKDIYRTSKRNQGNGVNGIGLHARFSVLIFITIVLSLNKRIKGKEACASFITDPVIFLVL